MPDPKGEIKTLFLSLSAFLLSNKENELDIIPWIWKYLMWCLQYMTKVGGWSCYWLFMSLRPESDIWFLWVNLSNGCVMHQKDGNRILDSI